MNSILFVFLIMNSYLSVDNCILPPSGFNGLTYGVKEEINHRDHVKVSCGNGEYAYLDCYNGYFYLGFPRININTFCGRETCFNKTFVDLNKTGGLKFSEACFKHKFAGGMCEMSCIDDDNKKFQWKCGDTGIPTLSGGDIPLACRAKKCTELTMPNATLTEYTENKCKITCNKGFELAPGITKGELIKNYENHGYRCYQNVCNYPQIRNGTYSDFFCILHQKVGCVYRCDPGFVANPDHIDQQTSIGTINCRKDKEWGAEKKNFCIGNPSTGNHGATPNKETAKEAPTNNGSTEEKNTGGEGERAPPQPEIPNGSTPQVGRKKETAEGATPSEETAKEAPTNNGSIGGNSSGGKPGDNEGKNKTKRRIRIKKRKPPKPKEESAVFAAKSIVLVLAWL